MRFATISPEAFPSYTSLAKLIFADTIIFADNLEFNKRLKLNRFALTADQDFTIPLNAGKTYNQTQFDCQSQWQRKLAHAIDEFYRGQPYYVHLASDLQNRIQAAPAASFADFSFGLLKSIHQLFGLTNKLVLASSISTKFDLEKLVQMQQSQSYLVEKEYISFLNAHSVQNLEPFEVGLKKPENSQEEISLRQAELFNYFAWGPYLKRLISIA
jgi:hypothetical protein